MTAADGNQFLNSLAMAGFKSPLLFSPAALASGAATNRNADTGRPQR
jgi:hypothetical protein